MADSQDNNKNTDATSKLNLQGIIASIIYISIILAIGLPLWWKTTSPSRHSLPDISSLLVHSQRIVNNFPICIVVLDDSIDRDELRNQLVQNWRSRISGQLAYEYDWKVRAAVQQEETVFDKNSDSLDKIDQQLDSLAGHNVKGKLWIYILPEGSSLIKSKDQYLFGRNRFVYIKNDGEIREDKSLLELIIEIVESTQSITYKTLEEQSTNYLLTPEIDLIINVIAENELLKEKIEEVHEIVDEHFIQMSGISELIKINAMTQVVHHAVAEHFIASHLTNRDDSERSVRLFNVSHVPELLNAIESRIVEPNNKQSHHLQLFFPVSPLLFHDTRTDSQSNVIVTPYRGGILIWNKPNDFVNGFRSFVRHLLGINQSTKSRPDIFFAKWELDAIVRSITCLQLSKTLSSLESISKLIHKVSNIVIIEEIAKRMHMAVDLSHQSIDHLEVANLSDAYKLSRRAYHSAETAFFDPSLLALLYFPEDQKYAVYFPLFLPVSLPLIASIYHLFRTLKQRKKLKSD